MIEKWVEFSSFKEKSQRLVDHLSTIIKRGWFSHLEILEIQKQIYWETNQRTPITETKTLNTEKNFKPKAVLSNSNGNAIHPNKTEQSRTPEEKNIW